MTPLLQAETYLNSELVQLRLRLIVRIAYLSSLYVP